MLYRTLLIGLGGTGVDVLRKFKTHYVSFAGDESIEHISLLGVDTAVQLQGPDELLSAEQFLQLASSPITLQMVRQYQDRPYLSWLRDRSLPAFTVSAGAGQRRLAGYLAYLWKGAEVRSRIEAAINSLYRPQINNRLQNLADGGETRVFIISSVCGGTGTGMYLDVAFLVDEISRRNGWNFKKFGVLFTPSAFPQLAIDHRTRESVRANGYAALEELNYYMQSSYETHDIPSPDRANGAMSISGSAFDLCFIIGGQNERGQVVSQSLDLYRQTADFLFTAIAFPKISENLVQYFAVNEQGSYAAVGSFTLPLPQALFVAKYLRNMGQEVLNDILADTPDEDLSIDGVLHATRFSEAENPGQAHLLRESVGNLNQTVFIHGQPSSHDEADIYMREEARTAAEHESQYRPQIQREAHQIRSSILSQIETQTDAIQRLNKGVIAQQASLYRGVAQRIARLNAPLDARGGAATIDQVLKTSLTRPRVFRPGIRRLSPEARLSEFRSGLAAAFRDGVLASLRSDLKLELNRLRLECEARSHSFSTLIEDRDAIGTTFHTYALSYLQNRRSADSSDRILETTLAQDLIPADRNKEERLAFLNVCRAELKLSDILTDRRTLDIPKFIESLFKVTNEWVRKGISLAETLDSDKFEAGLNRSWTNLQISDSPESGVKTKNIIFAPPDRKIREQLNERMRSWAGAAGVEPDFQELPDSNVVTFLRIRGGFGLHEIIEMDDLKKSFKLASEDEQRAPFLQIPTHRRRPLKLDNEPAEQAKYTALALALEILRPYGQNFTFGDGRNFVLVLDEPDPVKRQRTIQKRMLHPDYVEHIHRAMNSKIDQLGNSGFGQFLADKLSTLYGALSGSPELQRLLREERLQLHAYCESIGVNLNDPKTEA